MTLSSFPVMKVAGTGSGLASSNVRGLDGLGTGGGGTGGTGAWSDSVRRTVEDPEMRIALAGKTAPFAPSAPSAPSAPAARTSPPLPAVLPAVLPLPASPVCPRISSSVCSWRW